MLGEGVEMVNGSKVKAMYLNIVTSEALPDKTRQRISDWYKVRIKTEAVVLRFDVENKQRKRSGDFCQRLYHLAGRLNQDVPLGQERVPYQSGFDVLHGLFG